MPKYEFFLSDFSNADSFEVVSSIHNVVGEDELEAAINLATNYTSASLTKVSSLEELNFLLEPSLINIIKKIG